MISRKNKLKPLNIIQQKYFKTSQKKLNRYEACSNDNIKSGSVKTSSKKLTTNKLKKKGGRKITQNKPIFTKKSIDRIGGRPIVQESNTSINPPGSAYGQRGPIEPAVPNQETQVTAATKDGYAAEDGKEASAVVPGELGAASSERGSLSSTKLKVSSNDDSGSGDDSGRENSGEEGNEDSSEEGSDDNKKENSTTLVAVEQGLDKQSQLSEKEINPSEISKRLTLIEEYLGIPLVKTGGNKEEAECQNVNLKNDHSQAVLDKDTDENAYDISITKVDDQKNLSSLLTKMVSYLGGARKEGYSSQIQFKQHPDQANMQGIELNTYDWVPVDEPNDGQKVPTNYNLLFQRLLLLSAIPLNRNEKVLLESLIKVYGDNGKLGKELLQLIGLQNEST